MDSVNLNPDIRGGINLKGSHTSQFGFSSNLVGGRRRRHRRKSIKHKKSKLRRKHTRKYKSRRHRRQRGGINPMATYRTYSTSLEPGVNGMYANGPSVGKIIEKFN